MIRITTIQTNFIYCLSIITESYLFFCLSHTSHCPIRHANLNPLWSELRLYNIFQYFMYFSDSTGLNLKIKKKKVPYLKGLRLCIYHAIKSVCVRLPVNNSYEEKNKKVQIEIYLFFSDFYFNLEKLLLKLYI